MRKNPWNLIAGWLAPPFIRFKAKSQRHHGRRLSDVVSNVTHTGKMVKNNKRMYSDWQAAEVYQTLSKSAHRRTHANMLSAVHANSGERSVAHATPLR